MRFMPFVKGKKGFQFAGGGFSSDAGGGGGGGSTSNVPTYYPNETVIATLNNKPLYAKTYTGRTDTSTVNISLPNINYFNVIKESSYSTCDDGNYKLPFGFYDSTGFRYQAFYNSSTSNIEIASVGGGFLGDYVLTVMYQKTTD